MTDKRTLTIDDCNVSYNQYDRPLYRECTYPEVQFSFYGEGTIYENCGADAMYIVSYWIGLSQKDEITRIVCERHYKEVLNLAMQAGYTIIDNRKDKTV